MEERCRQILSDILVQVKQLDADFAGSDWHFAKEQDGCKIHNMHIPNYPTRIWRGHMTIPGVTMDEVKTLLTTVGDKELLKRVDPDCVYFKLIENVSEDIQIYHSQYTPNTWFVSDRDFILVRGRYEEGDTFIQFGCSIEEKLADDEIVSSRPTACVRGSIYMYAKVVKKTENGVTMDAYSHTNPNGMIPTELVNLTSASQSLSVLRLKTELLSGK